jgi:hypothetical protein
MAEQLCEGFVHHDQRNRDAAVEAFTEVDRRQFAHLDEEAAREAAVSYVDALWAKDAVERRCMVDGQLDMEALEDADWSSVRVGFRARAEAAGIDPRYADQSTVAWLRHKVGGDYGTPIKRAQMYELRAALQDPNYPHKPRYGESGFGPEAARYELGVELHDMRRWEEAVEAMVPYFAFILRAHDD